MLNITPDKYSIYCKKKLKSIKPKHFQIRKTKLKKKKKSKTRC